MRHFKQIASADEDCRIDFEGHFLVVDQLAQENRVMDFDGKRIFGCGLPGEWERGRKPYPPCVIFGGEAKRWNVLDLD